MATNTGKQLRFDLERDLSLFSGPDEGEGGCNVPPWANGLGRSGQEVAHSVPGAFCNPVLEVDEKPSESGSGAALNFYARERGRTQSRTDEQVPKRNSATRFNCSWTRRSRWVFPNHKTAIQPNRQAICKKSFNLSTATEPRDAAGRTLTQGDKESKLKKFRNS